MNHDKPNTTDALRRRVEDLLDIAPESLQLDDLRDVNTLVRELAVHQAELELQNQELRNTQNVLQEASDRFAWLYEHAPVGYVVLDDAGTIRQSNATWGAMLRRQVDDFRGKAFADMLVEDDACIFRARYRAFFRNPASKQIEVRIKRHGECPFYARIEAQARAVQCGGGTKDSTPHELLVIVSDISDLQVARVEIESRNTELAASNERLDHSNRILLGIRNVNKLILTEHDPQRLIEGACSNLTATMGCHIAWGVLLGGEVGRRLGLPDVGPVATAAAGFDGQFRMLRERLERGDFPACVSRALEADGVQLVDAPAAQCPDCPLPCSTKQRAGLACRLAFEDVTYGILKVSAPIAYSRNAEAQDLFNALADDLAFALHTIAETRAREQHEQRLSLVIDGSAVGTWEWNAQTNSTVFNEQWAAMLGYTLEELTPYDYATWERLTHADDLARATEVLTDCVEGRSPDYSCELRMKHKAGHWVWILARGRVMTRDDEGKALFLFGTHIDISFVKQAEEELRESQAYQQQILQTAADGFWIVDRNGRILEVNDVLCRMTRYERHELLGLRIRDVDALEKPQETSARMERIMRNGAEVFETRHRRKDGSVFPVEMSTSYLNLRGGQFICFCRDLTLRKQAEEATREATIRLREAIRAGNVGLWDWNLVTNEVHFSSEWKAQIGYEEHEITDDIDEWKERVHPDDLTPALALMEKAIDEKTQQYQVEFRLRHRDGSYRCILSQCSVLRDENGRAVRVLGSHVDLTEQKAREKQLILLGQMLDKAPACISIHDTDGRFVFANAENVALHGYDSLEEFMDVNLHELDVPECEVLLAERFRRIAEEGEARFEVAHYRKNSSTFPLEVLAKQIEWEGRPAILSIAADITERKQAEEALKTSERQVRAKLDALLDPDGDLEALELVDVINWDDIQILMNNFHALTDIGVGIVDLEGKVLVGIGWQEVCTKYHRCHPESARNCHESDTFLASGVEPGTFRAYKCKNNMWDMVTPIMIGGRHLGNLFLGQFFYDDEEPNVDLFLEQARRYGFDEEAYLAAYRSIPRWSRETTNQVMTFYCNLIGVISRLSYAQIKLARASESLRQSEQRFRSFVENANDIVYALTPEGCFTYVSPNWLELMGEPAEQAIGQPIELYVHPDDSHLCRAFLEKTLMTGVKQSSVEYRVRHQDGTWRWHVSKGSPVRDSSGTVTGYVGIDRDMTESKQAEEERERLSDQLAQAQKMESIGRLAGGVAHDFNNMLTVIKGQAEILLKVFSRDPKVRQRLEHIEQAANASANLTRQLLAFARKEKIKPAILDLNEAIGQTLKMLRRLIGENIELLWQLDPALHKVMIDPSQVDQLLANLCVNARDAIRGTGTILLETSNQVEPASTPGVETASLVRLRVSDDGCGMSPETIEYIFEPFFTTKEVGEGTGLGLATVFGIVTQNGGRINVDSVPGQGTTFDILLPACETPAPALEAVTPKTHAIPRGHEAILVVEDERAILLMLTDMLQSLGYHVFSAASPDEALNIAGSFGDQLQLVITDVIMPRMNGKELSERLRDKFPHHKVIFISGYTADVIGEHGVLDDGLHFLQKPFSLLTVARMIRQVLDQPPEQ